VGACDLPPSFTVSRRSRARSPPRARQPDVERGCTAVRRHGSVTYASVRSTASGFTLNWPAASRGLTGTSYSDTADLASGTTYYYVVRATGHGNGVEDANVVQSSGVPYGPVASTSLYTESFDRLADGNLGRLGSRVLLRQLPTTGAG